MTHQDQHELTVMSLKGEFNGDEPDRFRRVALERIDARIRDFVLDLDGLEAVDSQGLEALLWLQDQCADHLGQVRLARCPEYVHTVLRATRLDRRFECHADIDAAVRSLG